MVLYHLKPCFYYGVCRTSEMIVKPQTIGYNQVKTMEYNRPRDRVRSFGVGLLSGSLISDEDVFAQLQENLNFRLQSARKMLTEGFSEEGLQPLERRQKLRERRMKLLSGEGDTEASEGADLSSSSGGSGMIGETGTSSSSSDTEAVSDSTPSMSEAQAGTKKRAEERGFGN